jgi:hypothetical protein
VTVRPSEVVRRAAHYLDRHGVESPQATAEVPLMHVLGTDRAGLYTRDEGLTHARRMFMRAIASGARARPSSTSPARRPSAGS